MNTQSDKNPLVWFITGASNGIGRELVREALRCGDSVIATSRTPQKVTEAFAEHQDRLLAVAMDLSSCDQITKAVDTGISRFGKVNVLVNNAGYGFILKSLLSISFWGASRMNKWLTKLPGYKRTSRPGVK